MLRIKQLKVYQPVDFENTLHTYFNTKQWLESQTNARSNIPRVDIVETEEGVLIKSDKDTVKVFRTNIAYINYYEDTKAETKTSAKSK